MIASSSFAFLQKVKALPHSSEQADWDQADYSHAASLSEDPAMPSAPPKLTHEQFLEYKVSKEMKVQQFQAVETQYEIKVMEVLTAQQSSVLVV